MDHYEEKAPRPMVNDDLVQLDNREDRAVPAELVALREHGRLYLSSLAGKPLTDQTLTRIDSCMGTLALGPDLVVGRLGQDVDASPPPARSAKAVDSLAPHIPDWSGITYHPKVSSARTALPYRRSKKKREPHYVFGADDRQVYYPSGYPWRCIGRINAWTNPSAGPAWSGTGALVGKNIVVTASHVCPWGASPWMMQFTPAFYDGASVLGRGVASYVQAYRGYQNHGQGDDMAVLKLYDPLGDSRPPDMRGDGLVGDGLG